MRARHSQSIEFDATPERVYSLADGEARRICSALREIRGARRSVALRLARRIEYQLVIAEDRRRYITLATQEERDLIAQTYAGVRPP